MRVLLIQSTLHSAIEIACKLIIVLFYFNWCKLLRECDVVLQEWMEMETKPEGMGRDGEDLYVAGWGWVRECLLASLSSGLFKAFRYFCSNDCYCGIWIPYKS